MITRSRKFFRPQKQPGLRHSDRSPVADPVARVDELHLDRGWRRLRPHVDEPVVELVADEEAPGALERSARTLFAAHRAVRPCGDGPGEELVDARRTAE